MNEQTQQRTREQQGGDQDDAQGYLLSIVPIADIGVLPGGQPPSAGKPVLADHLIREGLISPEGPSVPRCRIRFRGRASTGNARQRPPVVRLHHELPEPHP